MATLQNRAFLGSGLFSRFPAAALTWRAFQPDVLALPYGKLVQNLPENPCAYVEIVIIDFHPVFC